MCLSVTGRGRLMLSIDFERVFEALPSAVHSTERVATLRSEAGSLAASAVGDSFMPGYIERRLHARHED